MKDNSDVDAVGERGGGVGDGDCEGLKRRRRREVEEWRDEGEVVLGEDEAVVATDGADEVTVAGAGDGEFGGEADCLWVGPHDLNVNGKKEFEQQMEVLGRLRHPNLIGLKAYYFARDEKLLVHEFMPNGNLFWLLHAEAVKMRTMMRLTLPLANSGSTRGLVGGTLTRKAWNLFSQLMMRLPNKL
ncbi:inactive leucine-rich repeat receptor-like serine/threonine-protein kinase At1g60630 isoform X1 [Salvia miltiorrhiza]|uniref:inactive leucine-rich repeat receptor-like serine/threonine-protein kinase At1g60630 isoform X1 n=1 Tax=Salvia miltiorrhiza TaxID=226208 RepID=UPI0025AD971F|nr:inactive leucine-rich repeat receptor-like serine/threonine-protein kinase At1g60630 isoform X1 [Salvia miltiorrhiza]